jgi:hypothetical protein
LSLDIEDLDVDRMNEKKLPKGVGTPFGQLPLRASVKYLQGL